VINSARSAVLRAVLLKVYVVGKVRCVDRSILTDVSKVRFFQTSVTIYCPG
jgi:hypothetical protein